MDVVRHTIALSVGKRALWHLQGEMHTMHYGVGYVLLRRLGARWRADVYLSRPGKRPRLVAEITGSLGCVQKVAREAPALVAQPNGDELLVDFLCANRLRMLGPRRLLSRGLAGGVQQPMGVDLELASLADELNDGHAL